MNENLRTLFFLIVASICGLTAWGSLPRSATVANNSLKGQKLFDKFEPDNASKLEITTFDEVQGLPVTFAVAKLGGNWILPSHSNYPADAETQFTEALSSLKSVEALDIASELAADHPQFGVISPLDENATAAVSDAKTERAKRGIGTLVKMSDEKGNSLVTLIIGKEVVDHPGQRFVRSADGGTLPDTVCVVKLDASKFSTDFNQWIEPDLLKISQLDFSKLTLKDYSVDLLEDRGRVRPNLDLRLEAQVSVGDRPNSWLLERLLGFKNGRPTDQAIGDQEELNQARFDELRTALDELKIEDVVRKPEGMREQLKVSEKFAESEEILLSLQARGFYVKQNPNPADGYELFSGNGEVLVDTKDGVRYTLRFGGIVEGLKGIQKGSSGEKLNRYLLVTAQLSEETLAKPVLLPEESASKPDEEKVEGTEPAAKEPATKEPRPELELIQKENKRRQDEYENRLKTARQKVSDLNARFADWYYIISEDVYKKVHLGRSDMIKDSAVAKSLGFGVDAFRKLEQDGLKKSPPPGARGGAGGPGGLPPGFEGGFPPM